MTFTTRDEAAFFKRFEELCLKTGVGEPYGETRSFDAEQGYYIIEVSDELMGKMKLACEPDYDTLVSVYGAYNS